MLAKMLPDERHLMFVVLTLIEFAAILIDGTEVSSNRNKINNVRDIDEPHNKQPDYTQTLFTNNELLVSNQHQHNDQRQRRAQKVDGEPDDDVYNHQSDDYPAHNHQQADEMEYNGHSSGIGDHDDGLLHHSSSLSHARVSETVLSTNNVTNHMATTTTIGANGGDLSEQNENNSVDKILLSRDLIERTCQLDRGSQRSEQLNNTFLTYCTRYKLENLLSNEILMSIMHHDSRDCEKILDEFVQLDETINQFDNLFMKLLSRYNCHNGYSVKWNCDDCKKAYKDWLCSTHLPFYMNGERIKPCISFCERVEQRCPYLHPITREQYGGQPVFICRDPNIPFVPAITPDIPYSEPGKCYDLCHLSDNLTELVIDSLSKYDYDKCPDRGSIAGEVRNEQTPTARNDTKFQPLPSDSGDYPDSYQDENTIVLANRTDVDGQTKVLLGHTENRKTVHVHNKKLEELREVLANYKNQAKTHRYHADHSSIEHSRPQNEIHSS